ncbi:MAG TPA: diguanylate cyclase [Bryobacteraceae bacterium]|nr:diguanylate cyclase [Bryobacteraceae bacterium]
MISLLKTAFEMERLEKFKRVALECYGLALTSTEQNVIEVDHQQATQFRGELQALVSQLGEATSPGKLQNIQDLFREELREYRDSTHEQLRRLRKEMDAAAAALEEFAGNASARGDDHEKALKQALRALDVAAASDRLEAMKAAIRAASADILSSFEQMQAKNQFAIAQLKDEIRLLHQKLQAGRRPAALSAETWDRQDVDHRIEQMLSQNTSFCLVLIVLRNLKMLVSRYSGDVVEEALESLEVRLRDMLGGEAMLGRWTTNQFVAILRVSPSNAMVISRDAAQKLMEPYSFKHEGIPCTLVFQVAAGVVDHQAGSDVLKFRNKLASLSKALGGGPL